MKTFNAKNIGNLIRSERKKLGLTQGEIADKIGVTMQHYSRIERGEYIPSLPTFLRIKNFFKLETSILYEVEKNKVSSTMFEIISIIEAFPIHRQKAVLSFLKTMA